MQLIRELYAPNIAMLPISDFYTMGPKGATLSAGLLVSGKREQNESPYSGIVGGIQSASSGGLSNSSEYAQCTRFSGALSVVGGALIMRPPDESCRDACPNTT